MALETWDWEDKPGGRLGLARREASSRPFSWDFNGNIHSHKHTVATTRRGATRACVQGRDSMPCGQRVWPFRSPGKQLVFVRWVKQGVSKSAQRRESAHELSLLSPRQGVVELVSACLLLHFSFSPPQMGRLVCSGIVLYRVDTQQHVAAPGSVQWPSPCMGHRACHLRQPLRPSLGLLWATPANAGSGQCMPLSLLAQCITMRYLPHPPRLCSYTPPPPPAHDAGRSAGVWARARRVPGGGQTDEHLDRAR